MIRSITISLPPWAREGDESQPSEVSFASTPKASLTVPPLEIGKVELSEAFASAYKYYETHPSEK